MKRKNLGVVAILATVLLSLSGIANGQRILGGYRVIESDNAEAAEAAEFAVSKKSEEQEGLTLSSVEKAERQSVQGANFRLCIQVTLEDESQFVRTVVYRSLQGEFTLRSWDVVENCG